MPPIHCDQCCVASFEWVWMALDFPQKTSRIPRPHPYHYMAYRISSKHVPVILCAVLREGALLYVACDSCFLHAKENPTTKCCWAVLNYLCFKHGFKYMAHLTGFEPVTIRLEGECSIQLNLYKYLTLILTFFSKFMLYFWVAFNTQIFS